MSFDVRAATAADLPAILAIYNRVILETRAIWKDEPASLDERRSWFAARTAAGYPVLVAARSDEDRRVAGYAAIGDFRHGSGFRFTCENTVHVLPEYARRGIGRGLMARLIVEAAAIGKTRMIAAIGLPNAPSVALHRGLGFTEAGVLEGVGHKHGEALDLLWMHRALGPGL